MTLNIPPIISILHSVMVLDKKVNSGFILHKIESLGDIWSTFKVDGGKLHNPLYWKGVLCILARYK